MRSHALAVPDKTDPLFSGARDRGLRAMLRAALTGRSGCLLALEEVRQRCHVVTIEESQFGAGTRLEPNAQIVGCEGPCGDFDRDLNTLHDHTREHWLRIAAASQRRTPLPPVDLVQVGDLYFVHDGHHRISVTRALVQPGIEARVTVWRLSGTLPWETQARPNMRRHGRPLRLKTLAGRLHDGILTYAPALQ